MTRIYNKAYKFRLLPNRDQKEMLSQTFGCVRFIWNQMLSYSINYYNEHGREGPGFRFFYDKFICE